MSTSFPNILNIDGNTVTVDEDPTTIITQLTDNEFVHGGAVVIWESDFSGTYMDRWFSLNGDKTVVQPLIARDNLDGTAAPTVSDDITKGYTPFSKWLDTVAQDVYVCVKSDVPNNAVWKAIT